MKSLYLKHGLLISAVFRIRYILDRILISIRHTNLRTDPVQDPACNLTGC